MSFVKADLFYNFLKNFVNLTWLDIVMVILHSN
jgi:hypothetical protein